MVGDENGEASSPQECPRVISPSFKQRFPLAAFNRLKKDRTNAIIEASEGISDLRCQLHEKAGELEDLKKKVHRLEERIRRKKRRIAEIEDGDDSNGEAKKKKENRRPIVTSEINAL